MSGWLIARIATLLFLLVPTLAAATPRLTVRVTCTSVTPRDVPDARAFTLPFRCGGEPSAYSDGSLWIRVPPADVALFRQGAALLVHQTRVERITAFFRHPDGSVTRQTVRAGDYGRRWRVGAQISFSDQGHPGGISGMVLRLDGMVSHRLLRARLLDPLVAAQEMGLLAALIGAAEVLLLLGATYNLGLGIAMRRFDLIWQGAWAGTVFIWGIAWSQLALVLFPDLAGTDAALLSTLLSCSAIALASFSVATALRGVVPRWLSGSGIAVGVAMLALALPYTVSRWAVQQLAVLLNIGTLSALAIGAATIAVGWRRGSVTARTLAYGWGVPMLVLATVEILDVSPRLFGGGAQVAVLFACAAQTAWLSIAATLGFAGLRGERDAALAVGVEMSEIARRDPLTGLLNRRGFLHRISAATRADEATALLLVDIDHFKSINDRFGHEAGDAVLVSVAECLHRFEGPNCVVARLGGEEFLLGTHGLGRAENAALAEAVRQSIELAEHSPLGRQWTVTVSIGVAEGASATPFQKLYGMADRALYAAKAGGRNRVMWHGVDASRPADAQLSLEF